MERPDCFYCVPCCNSVPALCGLSLSISRILFVKQLQEQGQIGSSRVDQSPLEWITDANLASVCGGWGVCKDGARRDSSLEE